jgi:hypothetical protein
VNEERQEWINKRAYSLWEQHGREHGHDQEHWEQATRERDELERIALPHHLKRSGSGEVDDATRNAINVTRNTPAAASGKSRPTADRGNAA